MLTIAEDTEIIRQILNEDFLLPIIAIFAGTLIAIVAIIRSMVVARAKEQTKREIAAYVAEGSIDPEQAAKLIAADKPWWEKTPS